MAGLGVTAATPEVDATPVGGDGDGIPPPDLARSFFAWGAASYLVITLVIVAFSVARAGGELVYVIDDPAIHLSVAENLVHHGTWGVAPGHFESASSSPLWTLLLSAWIAVVPGPDEIAPLALNVIAGLAVIAVVAAGQRILWPGLRRPVEAMAVAALVNVVLFLPGLAMTGMEHSLHIALALAGLALLHRAVLGRPRLGPGWLPYALVGLATLTRFETAFLAAGIAVALYLLQPGAGPAGRAGWVSWSRVRWPLLVVASAALPLAGFALFNRAMGQGWLPNSVSAKSAVTRTASTAATFEGALNRFSTDPLVAGLTAVMAVALIVAARRAASWSFPAVVLVVTVALHMLLARVGWYERYQAYLIAVGVYALVCLIGEQLPATSLPPARSLAVAGLVAVMLTLSGNKPAATFRAAEAVGETYDQRYQAALFLSRYYQGEPIATGELGYISLFHDGPITDVFGLGDYEVLQAWGGSAGPPVDGERSAADGRPPAEFWEDLAERRGFAVVAVYPLTLLGVVPESWIPVGRWDLGRLISTAPGPEFEFYATTPEAVGPLRDHLIEFSDELPDRVETELNELAGLRADELAQAGSAGDG
jgi:hypothetical protein